MMDRIPPEVPQRPSTVRKALGIGVGIFGAVIGAAIGVVVGNLIVIVWIFFYSILGFTSPITEIIAALGLAQIALFIANWGLSLIGAAWFGWAGYLVAYGLVVKKERQA